MRIAIIAAVITIFPVPLILVVSPPSVAEGPDMVEIIAPSDGSTLSNQIVVVVVRIIDSSGIRSWSFSLDGGDEVIKVGTGTFRFNVTAPFGEHDILIEATDLSGHDEIDSAHFHTGRPSDLSFTAPANGTHTSVREIDLAWSYSGPMSIERFEIYDDGIGDWVDVPPTLKELTVRLDEEGEHRYIVRGHDEWGNYVDGLVTIMVDRSAPVLHMIGERGLYNSTTIRFEWLATDPSDIDHYNVSLDGWPRAEYLNDTFIMISKIPYTQGGSGSSNGHEIEIEAVDGCGNSQKVAHDFSIDTEPPTVEVLEPSPGWTVLGRTFSARFYAQDVSGIGESAFVFRGLAYHADTGQTIRINGPPGPCNLSLVVVDGAGLRTIVNLSFILDASPPVVVLSEEVPTVTNLTSVDLSWKAMDDGGIRVLRVITGISCREYDPDELAAMVNLVEGWNRIIVQAEDNAFRTTERSVVILSDRSPPELDLLDVQVRGAVAIVEWNLRDRLTEVCSIRVMIDGEEIWCGAVNRSMTIEVPADGSEHWIEVSTVDGAGNRISYFTSFVSPSPRSGDQETDLPYVLIIAIGIASVIGLSSLRLLKRTGPGRSR
jgi:hypothetical protein